MKPTTGQASNLARGVAPSPAWIAVPACLFAIVTAALSLIRHYSFESFEDLAMFDQMLWNCWNGRGLVTTVSGNYLLMFAHHFFGEHFAPVLFLLAPLAGLCRGPEGLLVFQAAVVALSALPAALWARARLGESAVVFWVPWLWLALPALWLATLYDFHMESLGPALFFAFLLAMHRRSRMVWLWAVLFAATKEDAPVYLALAAITAGWISGRLRFGLVLALGAICYFLAVWFWVIPAFSPTAEPLLAGRLLTPKACGGLGGWIEAVGLDRFRWGALLGHLAAFGFLPLAGGAALLPAGAAVGVMWLSGAGVQNAIRLHYPFSVYPLFFFAAIEGARLALQWQQRRWPRLARARALGLLTALWLAGIVSAWMSAGDEWSTTMRSASWQRVRVLERARRTLAEQVPPDASVAASQTLLAHLARRNVLELFPGGNNAGWIALLTYHHEMPGYLYYDNLRRVLGEESAYGCRSLTDERLVILQRGAGARLPSRDAKRLTQIYECERLAHRAGAMVKDAEAINGFAWSVSATDGDPRPVQYGPYNDYPPGRYRIEFRVAYSGPADREWLALDVVEQCGLRVCGAARLRGASSGYTNVAIEADLATGAQVEFRCMREAPGDVRLDRLVMEP